MRFSTLTYLSVTFFVLLLNSSRLKTFLTSLHSSELLCINFGFVKFFKEGVIGSGDEVETTRFAVLLTEVGDHFESLFVILNFIRSFKLSHIFLTNDSLKEGLNVGFTTVGLSVWLKSPVHFFIFPMRLLDLICGEILHSLFQESIISL